MSWIDGDREGEEKLNFEEDGGSCWRGKGEELEEEEEGGGRKEEVVRAEPCEGKK